MTDDPNQPDGPPDDLDEIEQRATREPGSVAPEDHDRLARHYWKRAKQADDPRDRRDRLKRAAFFVGHAIERGLTNPDHLESYLLMLEAAAEVQFDAAKLRYHQAVVRSRLADIRGESSDYHIVDQVFGEAQIDGGMIYLADLEQLPEPSGPRNEQTHLEWMKHGRLLALQSGDGVFPIELRLVEGDLPRLAPRELQGVTRCTAAIALKVPSGRFAMGDLPIPPDPELFEGDHHPWVELDHPGGSFWSALGSLLPDGLGGQICMKACIYALPDRYVGVLSRTDDSPPNDVRSLEEL